MAPTKIQFPMFRLQSRTTGTALVYRPQTDTRVRFPLFFLNSDAEDFIRRHGLDCIVVPVSSPKVLYWLLLSPPGIEASVEFHVVFDPIDVETDDVPLFSRANLLTMTESCKDHHF